jgi:hypothetical protein
MKFATILSAVALAIVASSASAQCQTKTCPTSGFQPVHRPVHAPYYQPVHSSPVYSTPVYVEPIDPEPPFTEPEPVSEDTGFESVGVTYDVQIKHPLTFDWKTNPGI